MYIDMTTTQYEMQEFWNDCKWACDDELWQMLNIVPSS